jgi:hypothetical protein
LRGADRLVVGRSALTADHPGEFVSRLRAKTALAVP